MRIISRYLPLLLIALVWEAATRTGLAAGLDLPPISEILRAWLDLLASGDLTSHGISSLYRAAAGLLLAVLIGGVAGVLMAWFRPINVLLAPLIEIFYPLPKSALIPVIAFWLGFGDGSKILLIFLGCMLPVTIGAFNGARGSEQVLLWSARGMGAGRFRLLWDVVVPSALPELLGGIRTAVALSFVLLVTSELISSHRGLGHMIGVAGSGGVYDAMFATVLTVALLGFLADRLFLRVMRRALRWQQA
jgi:ABC-type nitrate/sulfonate/bicarbonate transport system permease component